MNGAFDILLQKEKMFERWLESELISETNNCDYENTKEFT